MEKQLKIKVFEYAILKLIALYMKSKNLETLKEFYENNIFTKQKILLSLHYIIGVHDMQERLILLQLFDSFYAKQIGYVENDIEKAIDQNQTIFSFENEYIHRKTRITKWEPGSLRIFGNTVYYTNNSPYTTDVFNLMVISKIDGYSAESKIESVVGLFIKESIQLYPDVLLPAYYDLIDKAFIHLDKDELAKSFPESDEESLRHSGYKLSGWQTYRFLDPDCNKRVDSNIMAGEKTLYCLNWEKRLLC